MPYHTLFPHTTPAPDNDCHPDPRKPAFPPCFAQSGLPSDILLPASAPSHDSGILLYAPNRCSRTASEAPAVYQTYRILCHGAAARPPVHTVPILSALSHSFDPSFPFLLLITRLNRQNRQRPAFWRITACALFILCRESGKYVLEEFHYRQVSSASGVGQIVIACACSNSLRFP